MFLQIDQALSQKLDPIKVGGQLVDQGTARPLPSATVLCVSARDTLVTYTAVTDESGFFEFDNLVPGKYSLQISSVGYESYTLQFVLDKQLSKKFGKVEIKRKEYHLTTFEVVGVKKLVRLTRDTLEFSMASLRKKGNDQIVDVLKKIPGFDVDREGVIRFNGVVIDNIMINGQKLLGNSDPKTFLRNLQADLVDKLQIIDKNDGDDDTKKDLNTKSEKVINLTIRKEKEGVFSGDLTGGIGLGTKMGAKVNLNRFKEQQQLLMLGEANNFNGLLESKSTSGPQLQTTWDTRINYADKLSERVAFATAFSTNVVYSENWQNSQRRTNIGDSAILYTRNSVNKQTIYNHDFSIRAAIKVDSFQKLTITSHISNVGLNGSLLSNYQSSIGNRESSNNGNVENKNEQSTLTWSGSGRYEVNFQKKGRKAELWLSYANGREMNRLLNRSFTQYMSGNNISIDTIAQKNTRITNRQSLLSGIAYTEPITLKSSLSVDFTHEHTILRSDRAVLDYNFKNALFDRSVDSLNILLNGYIKKDYGKITWSGSTEKFMYSLSAGFFSFKMLAHDIFRNTDFSINSMDFYPLMYFTYLVGKNKKLTFQYGNGLQIPELIQLMPIKDYADPLQIKVGNPLLSPAKSSFMSFTYTSIDPGLFHSFFLSGSANFLGNQIINSSNFDSSGRQIMKPINLRGGYTFNLNINQGWMFKKTKDQLRIGADLAYRKMIASINEVNLLV